MNPANVVLFKASNQNKVWNIFPVNNKNTDDIDDILVLSFLSLISRGIFIWSCPRGGVGALFSAFESKNNMQIEYT